MPTIDLKAKTVSFKIVLYGPEGAGKRSLLQAMDREIAQDGASNLGQLDGGGQEVTRLTMAYGDEVSGGLEATFHLLTIGGPVTHLACRDLLLTGADGVLFVVDASNPRHPEAADLWQRFLKWSRKQLKEGDPVREVAAQANQQDREGAIRQNQILELFPGQISWHESSAETGQGIFSGIDVICSRLVDSLAKEEKSNDDSADAEAD